MAQYETRTFDRADGTGRTTEYRTYGAESQTLAYLDLYDDRDCADAEVFTPYLGRGRMYGSRSRANAAAIIARHLTAEGYTELVG